MFKAIYRSTFGGSSENIHIRVSSNWNVQWYSRIFNAANLISSELIQNIHHVFSQQSIMAICDAAHINAPQQWWGVNMIAHMAFYHFGFFSPKNPNPDSLLLGRAVRRWYEQTWPSVCPQCKHTCGQSSQNKMMTIRKEIEYESSILKMTSRCQNTVIIETATGFLWW